MGEHSAKFYETGGDSSGQLGGVIFFRRHKGGWFVLYRKESGGFYAADRLHTSGEMIKDFINVVELNCFEYDFACTIRLQMHTRYMNSNCIPVAILVPVSTLKQENDRQISELQSYADSKGYEVVGICQ